MSLYYSGYLARLAALLLRPSCLPWTHPPTRPWTCPRTCPSGACVQTCPRACPQDGPHCSTRTSWSLRSERRKSNETLQLETRWIIKIIIQGNLKCLSKQANTLSPRLHYLKRHQKCNERQFKQSIQEGMENKSSQQTQTWLANLGQRMFFPGEHKN